MILATYNELRLILILLNLTNKRAKSELVLCPFHCRGPWTLQQQLATITVEGIGRVAYNHRQASADSDSPLQASKLPPSKVSILTVRLPPGSNFSASLQANGRSQLGLHVSPDITTQNCCLHQAELPEPWICCRVPSGTVCKAVFDLSVRVLRD
jgi:hypothetical protein